MDDRSSSGMDAGSPDAMDPLRPNRPAAGTSRSAPKTVSRGTATTPHRAVAAVPDRNEPLAERGIVILGFEDVLVESRGAELRMAHRCFQMIRRVDRVLAQVPMEAAYDVLLALEPDAPGVVDPILPARRLPSAPGSATARRGGTPPTLDTLRATPPVRPLDPARLRVLDALRRQERAPGARLRAVYTWACALTGISPCEDLLPLLDDAAAYLITHPIPLLPHTRDILADLGSAGARLGCWATGPTSGARATFDRHGLRSAFHVTHLAVPTDGEHALRTLGHVISLTGGRWARALRAGADYPVVVIAADQSPLHLAALHTPGVVVHAIARPAVPSLDALGSLLGTPAARQACQGLGLTIEPHGDVVFSEIILGGRPAWPTVMADVMTGLRRERPTTNVETVVREAVNAALDTLLGSPNA